jgi:hypothetical protein
MSLLAVYPSDLGPISLHHTSRGFETRCTHSNRITGEVRTMPIPQTAERAREFHVLCAKRGYLRRAFPEGVGDDD